MIIFFITFIISYFLLKLIIPYLEAFLVDLPNKRSSHKKATPTGGGIIFVLMTLIASISLGYYQTIIIIPLSIVGFFDDKYRLNASVRALVQVISSIFIVFFSKFYNNISPEINLFSDILLFVFLVGFCTAIINMINFMDGLDGLLGGCMLVTIMAISMGSNNVLLILCASLLGFLVFNWAPARVFMGDGGSTFLGGILCMLVLDKSNISEALSICFLITPLIADPAICIIRRFLANQDIFKAHQLHLFQRLHLAGWSHRKVSTLYISGSLLLSISYIFEGLKFTILTTIFIILVSFWLEKNKAIPFDKKYTN
ncbi:glycosyl transferase [Prochlorococcus marinus XMU1414]|uniref:Glycosyl transferase n=1 Tax=Prochlorococcus marinus XMU1424 TaxID=2774497 RepID=A0A9D9G1V0_PROMR|nr:glycosyl transferase [Prochlorococcus marinus]MBO8228685.1 glycosyl transferase [Prochlorococcus marinus XMU1414]MBW3046164.1 glycosyl transferase [Prochlorococcus marinus str. MU1414]MCR8531544.1 glycosyl transferase [Prochlorococcus marinus XMU1420]MCR8535273.1 glycosyl transferase [Prochlorococcus marinus XMU1424]